jgi:hypothetical protein
MTRDSILLCDALYSFIGKAEIYSIQDLNDAIYDIKLQIARSDDEEEIFFMKKAIEFLKAVK